MKQFTLEGYPKKKKSWDVSSTFATAKMELFVALVNSF